MATAPGELITIEGDEALATLPEGNRGRMKLAELFDRLRPKVPDSAGIVLPDCVKCAVPTPGGFSLVHVTPPRLHSFRWIAKDSEAEYGPGTSYRDVRLSLPYVVVLAQFEGAGHGVPTLGSQNQCFFINQPLEADGLETELCFPALLNCSLIQRGSGSISWICTQYLPHGDYMGRPNLETSVRDGIGALLRHLFESGFNRSSEHHEGASGFSATMEAEIDPRLSSVEAWEAASAAEPLFVLDMPWLSSGRTLGEIVGARSASQAGTLSTARDLARLIFNSGSGEQ